jgi:hypothetical protein
MPHAAQQIAHGRLAGRRRALRSRAPRRGGPPAHQPCGGAVRYQEERGRRAASYEVHGEPARFRQRRRDGVQGLSLVHLRAANSLLPPRGHLSAPQPDDSHPTSHRICMRSSGSCLPPAPLAERELSPQVHLGGGRAETRRHRGGAGDGRLRRHRDGRPKGPPVLSAKLRMSCLQCLACNTLKILATRHSNGRQQVSRSKPTLYQRRAIKIMGSRKFN